MEQVLGKHWDVVGEEWSGIKVRPRSEPVLGHGGLCEVGEESGVYFM